MGGKDKGVIEKTIEAVEQFANEVKEAAKHMMDPPEPVRSLVPSFGRQATLPYCFLPRSILQRSPTGTFKVSCDWCRRNDASELERYLD